MGVSVTRDIGLKPGVGGGGQGPGGNGPFGPDGPKDWPPGFTREDAIVPKKYRVGIWVALGSILMLFMALTSAYIVRQQPPEFGEGRTNDWVWIEMPSILWFTTAALLISSVTLERAKSWLKRNDYLRFNRWMVLTTVLGFVFLVGQVLAWRQLKELGTYSSSSPHGWFFYLLTSLHAIHLLGGVIALSYVTIAALRLRIGMKKRAAVDVTATYWHFMDGLWVYLFVLLFFWK
jgi:cytochrome c oxidase subunit 3